MKLDSSEFIAGDLNELCDFTFNRVETVNGIGL